MCIRRTVHSTRFYPRISRFPDCTCFGNCFAFFLVSCWPGGEFEVLAIVSMGICAVLFWLPGTAEFSYCSTESMELEIDIIFACKYVSDEV